MSRDPEPTVVGVLQEIRDEIRQLREAAQAAPATTGTAVAAALNGVARRVHNAQTYASR